MAENITNNKYEDMDEAEEEALLKSDDELEAAARAKVPPPPAAPFAEEEDSLMAEAVALEDQTNVEKGISEDDDDEDDDDLDESDKVLQEYKSILLELEKNQYAYDKYVRLCELSHATNDLDNIRTAYDLFAAVYPLSPELWLKYLSIEMGVAISPKEVLKAEELFKRALRDYYSIDIALEFAKLASRCAEPEVIWQELLGTYGLHCLQGQEFFKRYRQFLEANCKMSADEQQDAYIQSFLRELRYPLQNMEESYIEFKVFYEKNKSEISRELDWEHIDKQYFKAKELLQLIRPYEEQLVALDAKRYRERADVYTAYVRQSDKFLGEDVLQSVYERMVADCCLNAQCWLNYIEFIESRDEDGRPDELPALTVFQQNAVDVNNRALRNCTWSEKLYIKRMQLLEKQKKSRDEIQEILESSLSAGFQTAEPAVAIWLEYLTYLRRHTDWENEAECEILRKNFNLAWTILGQQWGVLADCNCEILQFWGRLEYGPLQDAKRGKELWTTVMESSDNATKSGLWIEFLQLEMRRDLDATRKLYRKAFYSAGLDNLSVISAAWERFERCNGTIETLDDCKYDIAKYQKQQHAPPHPVADGSEKAKYNKNTTATNAVTSKGTKRKSNTNTEAIQEKKAKTPPEMTKTSKHRAARVEEKYQESAFKEHENQEIDLSKDHLRIFLSNLDYNLTVDDIRTALPELEIVSVDLIHSANGKSRGFGYSELASASEVEKALTLDRRTLSGRPLFISSVLRDKEKRQKFKYSDGLEPKKLFVKGLPNDAAKAEVEQIFGAFGKLTDVRLVYHKSGKFKNIAYVEFEDEKAAKKAVMGVDQTELRDGTISVAISAPPPKPNTSTAAGNPTKTLGLHPKRNKVFDQKPRMSLIPNIVRKKLNTVGGVSAKMPPPAAAPTTAPSNGTVPSAKTNDDFRKLLQK